MLVILGVATTIGMNILRGWSLKIMWGWFVVETLGIPHLTTAAAIGILFTIAMIQGDAGYKKQANAEESKIMITSLLHKATFALSALGIGWIIHQFM